MACWIFKWLPPPCFMYRAYWTRLDYQLLSSLLCVLVIARLSQYLHSLLESTVHFRLLSVSWYLFNTFSLFNHWTRGSKGLGSTYWALPPCFMYRTKYGSIIAPSLLYVLGIARLTLSLQLVQSAFKTKSGLMSTYSVPLGCFNVLSKAQSAIFSSFNYQGSIRSSHLL